MSGHGFTAARASRRLSVFVTVLLAAALLPVLALSAPAQATAARTASQTTSSSPTWLPSVTLDKTVADSNDLDTVAQLGETLTYTFTVTNTGNVALTNLTITDAKLGMNRAACVSSLAVGATATCPPKTYVVTQADVTAGKVVNTAKVTASPSLVGAGAPGASVCVGLDGGKINTTGDPKTVTVTAPAGRLISGYCVKAGSTQQGNGPVYVAVDPPKSSVTISHPSGKAVSHYAVAYAVTDDDSAEIPAPAVAGISLRKAVADSNDADTVGSLGETLTYTFTVTNTGNVALTNVVLTDAKLGLGSAPCVSSLAVGETKTCPVKTYVVNASDVSAGAVTNNASVSATPPSGPAATAASHATMPTQSNNPGLHLEKSVVDSGDLDAVGSLGETLTYTFAVTNTGNVPLSNVTLTDAKLGLSGTPCVTALGVGETKTCPDRTYVVTGGDVVAGSVDNTATATGTPSTGGSVSDSDDATIATPAAPQISLTKTVADSNDAGTTADLGETLTYSFSVTNTGNVPISDVTLTDAKLGLSGAPCVATLAVGGTATCPSKAYVVTTADIAAGSITNVATATGKPATGGSVSDDDDADIATGAKAPSTSMTKSVTDSDDADSLASLGETLTYTFSVTNTGNLDLTDVTITDAKLGIAGAVCAASLPVGATTTCPGLAPTYVVTAADVARGAVLNTATSTAKAPSGAPVTAEASTSIPTEGTPPPLADVSLEKSADVALAGPGDTVTYTLVATNDGTADAHDVVVTDVLPDGVTFQSATAPCTQSGGTVTCDLGTVGAGGSETVTITVEVAPVGNAGGDTTHQHQLDYTKVEAHVSLFDDESGTVSASCPSGYVATDGSVRIDHVDAGTGTFEDVVVLASAVTPDGRGWSGTVRNDATGQIQAKVNVVCASERTTSGEDHSHPLTITGPVATTRTFTPGRHDVDLTCASGYAVRPSFWFTSGEGTVGTIRTATGWRFVVDVEAAATGTFAIHCLAPALGTAHGHDHELRLNEISDVLTVPAGETVETRLTCNGDQKGIVSAADMDPGLTSLGTDPQPVTRVYRFHNPTSSPLTAWISLLCVDIRTNGQAAGDRTVTNTASLTTSSVDASDADDSSSASITVSPTGVAVSPKASVVDGKRATAVVLKVATGTRRQVTFTLVANGKVKGTSLKAGSVLAKSTTKVKAGKGSVRLVATRAAAKALASGKVRKAKIVLTAKGGHRDVRVVSLGT